MPGDNESTVDVESESDDESTTTSPIDVDLEEDIRQQCASTRKKLLARVEKESENKQKRTVEQKWKEFRLSKGVGGLVQYARQIRDYQLKRSKRPKAPMNGIYNELIDDTPAISKQKHLQLRQP